MNPFAEDMINDILDEYGINNNETNHDHQYIVKESESVDEDNIETHESKNEDNRILGNYSWLFGNSIDEANLPGVENEDDDDDDDYTVPDSNEDQDTDDNTDADDNDDTTDDTPDNTPDAGGTDTQDVDEPDDNYDVPDAGADTQDAGDDAPTNAPEGGEDTEVDDAEGNEDDYTLPDAGEGEDNPEGEEGGEDNPDAEGDDDYDVPDAGEGGDEDNPEGGDDTGTDGTGDDDLGGDDSGEDVSDDVQIPNLREVQKQLFDQLTPDQQAIKIKELKNNYAELYTRCANILKSISDSNPGDENMVRVFDYVQKTMTDLQAHVYYYITNTFDTKTYMENDMQFKQFLTILNTIKNILDELNGEKKE